MCCWILIARILLRIFASLFSDIGLQFSFFVASLSGFGIRVMVASQNEFGSLPSSAIFWKLEQDRCQLFSKFLVEFTCEAIWSWAFVCWKISDYSFDFHACDGYVKFSISSWFSFGKLYFSKNLSISSKLSIFLAYSCRQQSLKILCISVLSVAISPFSFLIFLT